MLNLFYLVIFMAVSLAEEDGLKNFPYYDKDIFHPPRPGCVWNEERSKYYCGAGRAVPNRAPPPVPQIMEPPVEEITDISNETPVDISLLIPDLEEEPSLDKKPDDKGKTPPSPDKQPGDKGKTPPSPDKKPDDKGKTPSSPDKKPDDKGKTPSSPNKKPDDKGKTPSSPDKKPDDKGKPQPSPGKTDKKKQEPSRISVRQLRSKKFYLGVENQVTWEKAKQNCEEDSRTLANILNKSEQKYMEETINREAGFRDKRFWIGGRYTHDIRGFMWTTKHCFSFTNWAKGQPNDIDKIENCVQVYGAADFKWNDENCLSEHYYICEQELKTHKNIRKNT